MKPPRYTITIYDNGGKTADRYSVLFTGPEFDAVTNKGFVYCVGMSAQPFHPSGFCQHGEAKPGRHLGKQIAWDKLPRDCRKVIAQEYLSWKDLP